MLFARGAGDALLTGRRETIGLLAAARDQFADPTTIGDRHLFQFGAVGGMPPDVARSSPWSDVARSTGLRR